MLSLLRLECKQKNFSVEFSYFSFFLAPHLELKRYMHSYTPVVPSKTIYKGVPSPRPGSAPASQVASQDSPKRKLANGKVKWGKVNRMLESTELQDKTHFRSICVMCLGKKSRDNVQAYLISF